MRGEDAGGCFGGCCLGSSLWVRGWSPHARGCSKGAGSLVGACTDLKPSFEPCFVCLHVPILGVLAILSRIHTSASKGGHVLLSPVAAVVDGAAENHLGAIVFSCHLLSAFPHPLALALPMCRWCLCVVKVSVHPRGAQVRLSQKVTRQPAAKGRDPGDLEGEGIGLIRQKIPKIF